MSKTFSLGFTGIIQGSIFSNTNLSVVTDLLETRKESKNNYNSSQVVYNKFKLMESFERAIQKGEKVDWDGEGAFPLDSDSIEFMGMLLSVYPTALALPEIFPDPDGTLGLDWDFSDGTNLTIRMMPNGEIAYSVLGENEEAYGKLIWDKKKFPKRLQEMVCSYE